MTNDTFPGVPELTLTPDMAAPGGDVPVAGGQEALNENILTPREREAVAAFADKIDLSDTNAVLMFGAGAQKKIADFSESALSQVRTKDMGEVGGMLTGLVSELQGFAADGGSDKGFLGLFKRTGNQLSTLKARYDKAEVNVDKIVKVLEGHQIQLLKDVAMLDRMFDKNLEYFKELTMYVLAGQKRLDAARATELPALRERAASSGLPEDAQAVSDFEQKLNRFEKKLHDLKLTRIISLQMGPQIRLVQNNDTMMAERIQSSIVNTIPLWKNQMVLALGVAHSAQAIEAQRKVTDMTNEMLKKNAQTIKSGTAAAARESERGIVDIETLTETNRMLIETLDDVMRIQEEGREKRRAAEGELSRIELELKQKMLELRGPK